MLGIEGTLSEASTVQLHTTRSKNPLSVIVWAVLQKNLLEITPNENSSASKAT